MAALSGHFLGGHLLAVQRVGDGGGHRRGGVGAALVPQVGGVGVPVGHTVLGAGRQRPLEVLDVVQGGVVGHTLQAAVGVQPLGDGLALDAAVAVQNDIDRFVLVGFDRLCGKGGSGQTGRHAQAHKHCQPAPDVLFHAIVSFLIQ